MANRHTQLAQRISTQHADVLVHSGLRALRLGAGGITALANAVDGELREPFVAAIELLRSATGRVIVTGMGKSGHIARKIAATLASTGTPAFFVHPAEASHGDLGMITSDDAIIALSWSGETVELKNLINYSRRFRIGLIGITAVADSGLGKAADVVLQLPDEGEACPHNLAPTTSSLMQLALGDALAIALLENRGFSATDFQVFHPGGRLGTLLKFVRDFMFVGPRLPLIVQGATMAEAIVEITAKGIGCVGVIDKGGLLIGIITDGDLRRHMQPGLLQMPVENVMTPNPQTSVPEQLATEALRDLNSSKIHVLFVTVGGKPVGILHLHELLRAGAA